MASDMVEKLVKTVIDLKAGGMFMWEVLVNCSCEKVRDTRRILVLYDDEAETMKQYAFSKSKPCCACVSLIFTEFILGIPPSDFVYGVALCGVDSSHVMVQLRKEMNNFKKKRDDMVRRSLNRPLPPPPSPAHFL